MDITALRNLTYGLYVVGTNDNGRPTGCIINTCFQVTSENPIVAISMNKNNYTHDIIVRHGKFSLAILAEESDTSLITTFGFQCGRDRNKYTNYDYEWQNDVPILSGKFSGHIICEVLHIADNETHDVIFARVLNTIPDNGTPMTYAYYHHVIKGKAPKKRTNLHQGGKCFPRRSETKLREKVRLRSMRIHSRRRIARRF